MKRITAIYLFGTALLLSSCVYPFTPEVSATDERLVIEGNIYIGDETTVRVSYMSPVGPDVETLAPSSSTAWIESLGGEVYKKESGKNPNIHLFDLKNADPEDKYRLHVVNNDNAKEYVTPWLDVHEAPVIDSLSYRVNEENELELLLDAHTESAEEYFRWSFIEDWEYHSYFFAMYYYDKPSNSVIEYLEGENDDYYCWNTAESTKLMYTTTADLSDKSLHKHIYHKIDRHDQKISILYANQITIESMDKDCYDYWRNLDEISTYSGGLFSPNPSEVRGNIRCVSDSSELVLGYISASMVGRQRQFIANQDIKLYVEKDRYTTVEVDFNNQVYMYSVGYRPVSEIYSDDGQSIVAYNWAKVECVDCRLSGGTKDKPAFWPNNHK